MEPKALALKGILITRRLLSRDEGSSYELKARSPRRIIGGIGRIADRFVLANAASAATDAGIKANLLRSRELES